MQSIKNSVLEMFVRQTDGPSTFWASCVDKTVFDFLIELRITTITWVCKSIRIRFKKKIMKETGRTLQRLGHV